MFKSSLRFVGQASALAGALAVASLSFADGIGTTTATSLITSNIGDFAVAALAVLTAIIGVAVGLLVFRWGWRKIRGVAH